MLDFPAESYPSLEDVWNDEGNKAFRLKKKRDEAKEDMINTMLSVISNEFDGDPLDNWWEYKRRHSL